MSPPAQAAQDESASSTGVSLDMKRSLHRVKSIVLLTPDPEAMKPIT